MKGLVYTKVGSPDVLKISDVKTPVPKAKQVLIRVKTSSISNMEYMRFGSETNSGKAPFFARVINMGINATGKPLGADVAGVVEEVGKNVTGIKKGDEVFGITTGFIGGWAEYAVLDEKSLFLKPQTLSFEEAGAMPTGSITALGAVRAAKVKAGQKVLIHGASGGVGHYVVQIAKAFGATVTGVCSTRNLDVVRSVGADFVIDYKTEDFSKKGIHYDAIIVVNGYNPIKTYNKLLKKSGKCVFVGGMKQTMMGSFGSPFYSLFSSKKFTPVAFPFMPVKKSLTELKTLADGGKIKPFIDKVYSAYDIGDAIRYVIETHPQGKVVIDMSFTK
jgi:NADPH:quinone reductase-like Zn-dependent oxidoreductase